MLKPLTKYFSLILILILVNSNFSFAISQMICKMSDDKTICECSHRSESNSNQFSKQDEGCCKIEVIEINNSTNFETNNSTAVKDFSVQLVIYILPAASISNPYTQYNLYKDFNKPFSDIPILFSTLLI